MYYISGKAPPAPRDEPIEAKLLVVLAAVAVIAVPAALLYLAVTFL